MFTGLIEEVGVVERVNRGPTGLRIQVHCPGMASGLAIGESITIDGACQTVVAATPTAFEVDAVGDTLVKTTFNSYRQGQRVNLERAMAAGARIGGHIVTGHVTGTAGILSWAPGGSTGAWFLLLDLDPLWADRVAPEGSIAVDGISLTVAEVTGEHGFQARISIIPHTRTATTLGDKRTGDRVNVELDILASYTRAAVHALLGGSSNLSTEKLKEWGYS